MLVKEVKSQSVFLLNSNLIFTTGMYNKMKNDSLLLYIQSIKPGTHR